MSVIASRLPKPSPLTAAMPVVFIAPLLALALLPRVAATAHLQGAFIAAVALLGLWNLLILARASAADADRIEGRNDAQGVLGFDVIAIKSHYVQAMVQGSVYLYWASAWPWVRGQVPLILAQILYAYAFDLLLSWTRGRRFRLGFGPIPIILSSNFFLCFKDEWFYLQFAMISVGLLGREFIRWKRDGRSTHVFNPSAFGLFVFSMALILSGRTDLSWAQEIAIELGRPEHMYLYIFTAGLVVQYFFHVTLVTLSAATALVLLNTIYTQLTGVYWFLDAGIPIAVFLGLHLLITDPATSPRTPLGRVLFGALYGCSVFALYGLLEWAGAPRFYDKLLCVPVLNLTVRMLDRIARAGLRVRLPLQAAPRHPITRLIDIPMFAMARISRLDARQQNLLHMGLWAALFGWMAATHFVGDEHPGRSIAFWTQACSEQRRNACQDLYRIHHDDCGAGDAAACLRAGAAAVAGASPAAGPLAAAHEFARGCDLGHGEGCSRLVQIMSGPQRALLESACRRGSGQDCYIIGSARLMGLGVAQDRAAALEAFRRSCDLGLAQGCGILGDAYRFGMGTERDSRESVRAYANACMRSHALSCASLAGLLANGDGVLPDPQRARELRRQACRLDLAAACDPVP